VDINTILFALLGVLMTGYAVLDGFDLGVGTLSLFIRSEEERRLYITSIGPVWDGNQVWLLTTGNVLFCAFPLAFTTVFSGFYLALILLLVALGARAVATEYRFEYTSSRWVWFWDRAFGVGSLFSAVILGVALGNVLRGLPIGPGFVWKGSFLGLLNPYAIWIGLLSCALFVMHGALYLGMKTEGEVSHRNSRIALRAYVVFLSLYCVAAAATVHTSPFLFRKADSPAFWGLTALLVTALAAVPIMIRARRRGAAFIASSATIALMIVVTAWATYPMLVQSNLDPELSLTIYNAASAPGTLAAVLVIACIGMPIMLGYTFAVYWIFRGPTR